MKRLLTFFLFSVLVLSVSAQDNNIWFPEETVNLEGSTKEYTQEIWYEGALPGGGHYYGALPFWEAYRDDYEYAAEVISGNLEVTYVGYIENQKGVKVTFTGSKGAIKVSARNNGNFDGTQYSCSYILYYGGSSKRWDFNTKPYTVVSDRWWGSERHMANNENHPIYTPYLGTLNNNGNYLINEADGLKFETPSESFGYHNPNPNHYVRNKKGQMVDDPTSDSNIETRFICFKAGSKLSIPASYFSDYSNPRVRIKMGRDGHTTLNLVINNALDAVGTSCDASHGYYGIGGCSWWGYKDDAEHKNKFDYLYRGEYHFQIIDTKKDFVIEVPTWANQDQSNDWLMIYSIELYDSDEMITENSILGDHYQFLTTRFIGKTETVTNPAAFYVHYRGKGESSTVSNGTVSGTVGTLGQKTYSSTPAENKFLQRFTSSGGTDTHHTYTPEPGEYGTFRIRLEVKDHNGNYVTDYAYRTMSCGLLENKAYPYTWDLTDIDTYKDQNFCDDKGVETLAANKMALESASGYAEQPNNDYVHGVTYIPRNLWDEDGSLRVANEAGNYNVMFCDGSQLWYGNTIIPEVAGLGFLPNNFDGLYNGAMKLTAGGLLMDQDETSWWKWRILVPQVDNQCTIYVRAKKLKADTENFIVGYVYGDTGNKDPYEGYTPATGDLDGSARVVATVDNDVILAVPGPSQTTNVTLFFNGVEVHKIAVSKDPKTVNKYGWATESRDHVIDQELTSYFTGKDFVTYLVDEVNSSNTSVKLSDVTMTSNVMEKSNGSDYNAYIIRNKDAEILKDEDGNVVKDENDEVVATGKVDILNTGGGFHLFVPDIHDYVKIGENTSTYNQKSVNTYKPLLRAKLNPDGVVTKNETIDGVEYTNFVLTWQVADITEGQQGSQYDFENVGFFRVQDAGVQSKGNQGYLPLILASGNTTNKYNIVWDDDTNGIDATITDNVARRNDNVFYNLSGQRLNGVPTKGGIYIVNGKKIVVK